MSYEQILYEVSDAIATITLNRPEALNAWTDVMAEEVWQAMHAAERDDAVRVIVLTGAGRAFCAGGDVTGFKGQDERSRASCSTSCRAPTTSAAGPDYQGRASLLPRHPKPIIAMLNGATAGLGLVHALFADVRFAADDAVLHHRLRPHRPGVSEYGMAWALRNAVGHANALDLLLSARKVRGEEALRMGLVSQLHPREASSPKRPGLCEGDGRAVLAALDCG